MKPIKSDRFVCTEISGGAFSGVQCRVLVDRKTGVNYLWTTGWLRRRSDRPGGRRG